MNSAIARLWYGDIAPATQCGKNNGEIRELTGLMERHWETLAQTLNESQRDTLEKYASCMDEYVTLLTEQAFCEGFRLGSKLLGEALLKMESI